MTTSGYDSPTDVPGTEDLKELVLDMRWSWDRGVDELWNQIGPELWELTRSPCVPCHGVRRPGVVAVIADYIISVQTK